MALAAGRARPRLRRRSQRAAATCCCCGCLLNWLLNLPADAALVQVALCRRHLESLWVMSCTERETYVGIRDLRGGGPAKLACRGRPRKIMSLTLTPCGRLLRSLVPVRRPLKVGHQEHGCRPKGHPRHRVPMIGVMPPPVEWLLMLPRCGAGSSMLTAAICMLPGTALARTAAVACRLRSEGAYYMRCPHMRGRHRHSHQTTLHGSACKPGAGERGVVSCTYKFVAFSPTLCLTSSLWSPPYGLSLGAVDLVDLRCLPAEKLPVLCGHGANFCPRDAAVEPTPETGVTGTGCQTQCSSGDKCCRVDNCNCMLPSVRPSTSGKIVALSKCSRASQRHP